VPQMKKSPPELIERFGVVASRHPNGARRKMFGYASLFAGGNFATGLFEDRWVARLAPEDLAAALALPGAEPFEPMPGRPMRGWVVLPRDVVTDDQALDTWVSRALDFAASLPAKG
jgi:TfoX/Sxy family transcriptional regulator of competence genes